MELSHIVCFSGGHSSAIVAIEVVRKHGKENVILLNHDINPGREHADIKRFKREVAAYLGLPITYANIDGITDPEQIPDQFDVCIAKGGFKNPGTGDAFCTFKLKTEPFDQFLSLNFPDKNCVIYYGFDDDEQDRINRREFILEQKGFKTDFPLARWMPTIEATEDIGVARPLTYEVYKHGNCEGCTKAGMQHWYVTYCHRPDIFEKGKAAEEKMGYSMLTDRRGGERKALPLKHLEPTFAEMKAAGVPSTEHFAGFKKFLKQYRLPVIKDKISCECVK